MTGVSLRPSEGGQAIVELALTLPVILLVILPAFQFGVLFFAYLSMMSATWDTARWLSVHPHTTDDALRTAVSSRLPPNIDAAKLTFSLSPACSGLSDGRCAGRDLSERLSVTLSYNASSLFFLPSQFGCCGATAQLPTSLPPYTIQVVVDAP